MDNTRKEGHVPDEVRRTPTNGNLSRQMTSTARPGQMQDAELQRTDSIAEQMSLWKEFLFVGILCSVQFTTQMALNNTIAILHVIGDGLHITDSGVLSWLIAGYSLTVGSFILVSGRFGDMFGYKRMLVIGFGWFAIWNMVAGFAAYTGAELFIVARVFSGIGPAINLPNALGLLGATYPPGKRKDMIFSIFGACAPVGATAGGLFSSLWALVWWPWTYWTFGIVMFSLMILSILILPSVPLDVEVRHLSLKEKFIQLDLLGALAGLTAMILFNFAWNQAPGYGWQNVYIYVLLIIGVLMFLVFSWIEVKVAPKPLIPFEVFSANMFFVLGCVSCGWASFGIWIYYFYQFLQVLQGASPLLSVAKNSPVVISGLIAAITTGKVIHRIGPAWVMFIALSAFLAGTILTATAPIQQSYWAQIFVCTLIIPWGMDMSFPAATLILSNSISKKHQGVGASLVNTVVNYSISIGVGIAGTIEVHTNGSGRSEDDLLRGFRGALYLAIGLSAFGMAIALAFVLRTYANRAGQVRAVKRETA